MAILRTKKESLIKLLKYDYNTINNTLNKLGFPVEEENNEILIEITPDRPDLYSIEGIKRILDQYLRKEKREYHMYINKEYKIIYKNKIKTRPYIACCVIKNIKNKNNLYESLIDFQEKICEILGRKRKKIAIGIHDLNKIEFPVRYTLSKEDEEFIPLNKNEKMNFKEILENHEKGIKYKNITKEYITFKDEKGIISFPPIINSERTKITENTNNLFIDITGIHEELVKQSLKIVMTNLYERGCELYNVLINNKPQKISLDYIKTNINYDNLYNKIKKIIGIELNKKTILDYLLRMGYKVEKEKILLPPYRYDIFSDIDIISDITIAHDYNRINKKLKIKQTIGNLFENENKIKNIMTNMGFIEVKNYFLTNEKTKLRIINPITEEFTHIRNSLFKSLLNNAKINRDSKLPLKLFELDRVFKNKEIISLGFIIMDNELNINNGIKIMNTLFKELNINIKLILTKNKLFINNRIYNIIYNKKIIGYIGEINPDILIKNKIFNPITICEINLTDTPYFQ